MIVDQEPRTNLGGQAWWSFGGLFFVDSPEQRRMGIKDSLDLARQDWFGTAGFDREEDAWPRRWAEAYLQFAHQEKRAWLREKGVGFFPVVGWAERGGYTAHRPGQLRPALPHHVGHRPRHRRALPGRGRGRRGAGPRHDPRPPPRDGAHDRRTAPSPARAGDILAPSGAARGVASSREVVGSFEITAGGDDRLVGRHRRQPRPRAPELARAPGHARRRR